MPVTMPTALPPGHGHVIVCGVDHLGLRTIDELRRRDEEVVAISPTGDVAEGLTTINVRVVVGDPLLARTLREADLESAAAIVMTGGDDLTNLNIALAASEVRPDIRIVLRMFDTELGGHIPDLFPDAVALSSSALAAPGFVSAAIEGETGGRFELAGRVLSARSAREPSRGSRSLAIARLHDDRSVDLLPDVTGDDANLVYVDIAMPDEVESAVESGRSDVSAGPVRGALSALRDRLRAPEQRLLRFTTVLVFLAVASTLYFELITDWDPLEAVSYAITLLTGASLPVSIDLPANPAALQVYAILLSVVGAILIAIVYAFITDAMIRSRLLQTLGARTVPRSTHDHVVVAGLGAIGYRVALGLAARGIKVVVVETQDDGRFVGATRSAGIPVVIGDARHREVLDDVGIARARALVCATSDDLVNLSTALNGRAIRPDLRVVVRLYDPDFALRVQRGFGIRFTRSVSQLAAPAFAAAATRSEVVAAVPVGDRRMALFARLRIPAGSALERRPAASLDRTGAIRLLAVADPGIDEARWDVPADEILDIGEEVVVVATRAGLADLLHLATTPADTAPSVSGRQRQAPVALELG
jgi:Trk K+ transport system NAD-binding subunit